MKLAGLLLAVILVLQPWPTRGDRDASAFPGIPRHMLLSAYPLRNIGGNNTGSCFAVGPFTVVTAAHCVDGDGDFEVEARRGQGFGWVSAKLLKRDKNRDVAVLRLECRLEVTARVAPEDALEVGDALIAVGFPGPALAPCASVGYLAGREKETRHDEDGNLWQTSNAVFFGNSGGPVFDPRSGLVVGMQTRGAGSAFMGLAPNLAYIVSAKTLRKVLKDAGCE